MFLLVVGLVAAGCSDDDGPAANTAPGNPVQVSIADSLIFTRADSTVVAMGESTLVCCGLYDPGFVNERAMRIVRYDTGTPKPGWQILVLIDRAVAGAVTTLPTAVVPPSKVPYVSMFVADLANELSSETAGSSGTITVHSFSSTPARFGIDFSVDAVLGSEFGGGPSMRVQGTFQATFPAQSCP